MKKVTMIIGAGGVENAWTPVLTALNKYGIKDVNNDNANCIFANIVYSARRSILTNDGSIDYRLKEMNDIKKLIVEELRDAIKNKRIKAIDTIATVMRRHVKTEACALNVITTNWDTTIETFIDTKLKEWGINQKCEPLYIHGSIKDDYGIYLPTEVSIEQYRSDIDNDIFELKHLALLKALVETTKLIIIGCSLSPLDAELMDIIRTGIVSFNNKYINELVIVDKNPDIIENRIKILKAIDQDIKIVKINPKPEANIRST